MLGTRARPCEIESSDQQDAPFLVSESSFLLSLRSANGVAIGDTDDSGVSTMLLFLLCGYSVTRGREGSGRDYESARERATSLSGAARDGRAGGKEIAAGASWGFCCLPHNHSYLAS